MGIAPIVGKVLSFFVATTERKPNMYKQIIALTTSSLIAIVLLGSYPGVANATVVICIGKGDCICMTGRKNPDGCKGMIEKKAATKASVIDDDLYSEFEKRIGKPVTIQRAAPIGPAAQ
jgi:hypothetical protein